MVLSLALAGMAAIQRPRRSVRKVCAGCERQRAVFRSHGVVTWHRYHTLCARCFRAKRAAVTCRVLRAWC